MITNFIHNLYQVYVKLYFTYLEINPLVVTDKHVHILDLAAKLDGTADYLARPLWGEFAFPPPFGRDAYPGMYFLFKLLSVQVGRVACNFRGGLCCRHGFENWRKSEIDYRQ